MNGLEEPVGAKSWLFRGSWRGMVAGAKRRARTGVRLALSLACLLFLGLMALRHWPAHRRVRIPIVEPPRPLTRFEATYAQAQAWYFRAQVITKRQLESLEEWDPDGINGSAPEVYRRGLIAGTREIGRAEIAARQAAARATTNEEAYRATRLLVHVEQDLGHRRAELKEARRLVQLQPRNPGALLLLARAAEENGQTAFARQAQVKSGLSLGVSPGGPRHGRELAAHPVH